MRSSMRATRHTALSILTLALVAQSVGVLAEATLHAGDPRHGAVVYEVCMGCHSLDEDDVGPHHRGVVGRRAGSVRDFAYSPALRDSHIVWDVANLDRWLENPQKLVPGSRMFFAMPNPQDRADVVAYLSTQN